MADQPSVKPGVTLETLDAKLTTLVAHHEGKTGEAFNTLKTKHDKALAAIASVRIILNQIEQLPDLEVHDRGPLARTGLDVLKGIE